jgi:hypothetical protein
VIETLLGAAMELAADDRQIDLHQPSRSTSLVREASTVPAKWRAFARCVLKRETGGVLANSQSREDALNRSGSSASGRWQMLDASGWRAGGAWLVFKRLRSVGVSKSEAHRVRQYLAATPIHRWDGGFQDMAFIQSVLEGGWFHWRNGGPCDGLVPR